MTSAAANDANWAGAESSAGAPLWEEVEPLLRKTDWRAIVELLDNHETLTPRLRLIHAIARKEIDDERPGADQLAIDGMAGLLHVPASHPAAVVIAKRAVRCKRPETSPQEDLSALSAVMVFVMATVAGLVGFYANHALDMLKQL